MIDRVHHVGVVVHSADDALKFYRDIMGLEVTADQVVEEQGVRGVLLQVGENEIELLQPTREDTGVARYLESKGQILQHICFNTDDIRAELARLKAAGIQLVDEEPRNGLAGEVAFIHPRAMHGVLIELAQPPAGAHTSTAKGFDHLAVSVKDLEAGAQAWKTVVGLEVTNKIEPEGRGMVIGQMPSGQCIVELLAPTSPDSPMAQRLEAEGESAASMVAIEVDDLDAEVARYRAAGITLDDPAVGVLPNSRTATISAEQAFGLRIQLIEFSK
ncbi:MAG: methylmalonyl-CoA epimerase [Dehalococcoidia bacterium]